MVKSKEKCRTAVVRVSTLFLSKNQRKKSQGKIVQTDQIHQDPEVNLYVLILTKKIWKSKTEITFLIIKGDADFRMIVETILIGEKTILEETISGIKILTEKTKGDKTMEIILITETTVKDKMTTLTTEKTISMTRTTLEVSDMTTTGI